jgi:hypothetical protein
MVVKMKWAMTGLAALAVAQTGAAYAGLQDSDLWIGFSDSDNGFLLDEDSGNVWMTGPCLKALQPATQIGPVWVSHTVELVSIGRSMATLDQRFELDVNPSAPRIVVTSNGRGGAQSFSVTIDRNCEAGGRCGQLIASQQACQG